MDTSKTMSRASLLAIIAAVALCVSLAVGFAPPPAFAAGKGGGGDLAAGLQAQDDHGEVVAGPWEMGSPNASDVTAAIYGDGTLVIAGTGGTKAMTGYRDQPWASNRGSIKSIEFAGGVQPTNLDYWFQSCNALTSFATPIPDSVTSMRNTFSSCASMKTPPVLSANLENMDSTFFNCGSLESSPVIPNKVTSMSGTFNMCSKLITASDIPGSVKNLTSTFGECGSLKAPPSIGEGVEVMNSTFSGCRSLAYAPVLPSTVTSLDSTFYSCSLIEEMPEIPNGVTSMRNTFQGCTGIAEAKPIPASVTSIQYAFSSCQSLTSAPVLSEGLQNMSGAFRSCTALAQAPTIPSTVTNMSSAFSSCTALEHAPEIPASVTDMNSAFIGCTGLAQAPVIPSNVTDMGSAFSGCTALEHAPEIPGSVTNLSGAFSDCTSLVEFPLVPAGVTNMSNAFSGCAQITQIPKGFSIPEGANAATAFAVSAPYDKYENRLLTICDPEDYASLSAYDWASSGRILSISNDPVVAWKASLAADIAAARELLATYAVSVDGSDIEWPNSYITTQARDAFNAVIAASEGVYENEQATEADVKGAIKNLRDATSVLKLSEKYVQAPESKRLASLAIGNRVRVGTSWPPTYRIEEYAWDAPFDPVEAEHTVYVPINSTYVYVQPALPEGSTGTISVEYVRANDSSIEVTNTLANNGITSLSWLVASNSAKVNKLLVKIDGDVVYSIIVRRDLTPRSFNLVAGGDYVSLDPAFDAKVKEYQATVAHDAEVGINLGLYGTDTRVKVNSEPVEVEADASSGSSSNGVASATHKPDWGDNRSDSLTIELGDELGMTSRYDVALIEAPASISVSKQPDKTTYDVGEALNLAGMEVSAVYADGTQQVLSSDQYMASPAEGDIVGVDATSITVAAGPRSVEIPITVNNPRVPDELQLFGDLQMWTAGAGVTYKSQLPFSPEFDSAFTGYSVGLADGRLNLRFGNWYSDPPAQGVLTAEFTNAQTGEIVEKVLKPTGTDDGNSLEPVVSNTMKHNIVFLKVNGQVAYVISVHKKSKLSALLFQRSEDGGQSWVDQPLEPAFISHTNYLEYDYSMQLPKDSLLRVATLSASDATVKVAGEVVSQGAQVYNEVPLAWSDDRSYDLAIDVEQPGVVAGEYRVRIEEPASSLEVVTPPSKSAYVDGEAFDPAGMEVVATYADGTKRSLDGSELSFEPSVLALGTDKVVLSFRGASAEVPVTVGNAFEGEGTQESPFIIAAADDYDTLRRIVASGTSMEGRYLKQTADIVLPDNWTPIGVTKDGSNNIERGANLNAFSGTLDGDGHLVTVPAGRPPLIGYVKGATIKNMDIYGERISGHGLVNNLEGVGLAGTAVDIVNVTLKSGSSTLKSALVGGNMTTNGFAATSAGFVTSIRNCTVEPGVTVGYAGNEYMIGGIAGRLQGSVTNCVSYADVYGTNYVGGIVGSQDQAMGACIVRNCSFHGTVTASGNHAGGVLGGGYSNETAPNGGRAMISGCTVDGVITGLDRVGGIVGGDSYIDQSWGDVAFLKDNRFTGSVSATADNAEAVGGIVGFVNGLNKFDLIEGNYFSAGCGAECGIGKVRHVDTTKRDYGIDEATGVFYYNTSCEFPYEGFANWSEMEAAIHLIVDGIEDQYVSVVKTGFARDDDPLGDDAELLCYSDGQLADYSALDEALAKVPDYLDVCTDESKAALQETIDSIDKALPAWADGVQDQIDAWAQAVNEAVAGLEVDEDKAFAAAQAAVDKAEDLAKAAMQAADEFAQLKAAADAETDLVAKVAATAKAALAAVDAVAKANAAKDAADAAAAAAKLAARYASSDEVKEAAINLYEKAKDAQAEVANAVKAAVAASEAAAEAAKQAEADKAAADAAAKAPKDNPMKVTAKSVKAKAKKLKKKAQSVKAITVANAQGKVTSKITKISAKKKLAKQAKKKIKVTADGKLKLGKKLKKGTYKVTVAVTAAGNASYKAATKSVTVKVKVK